MASDPESLFKPGATYLVLRDENALRDNLDQGNTSQKERWGAFEAACAAPSFAIDAAKECGKKNLITRIEQAAKKAKNRTLR